MRLKAAVRQLIDELHLAMMRFEEEVGRSHHRRHGKRGCEVVRCVVCRRRAQDVIDAGRKAIDALRSVA